MSTWQARLFYGFQIALAALVIGYIAPQVDGDPYLLGLLVLLNIAAQLMPIPIYGETSISVGFVLTLAIIMLFGAPGVAIASPIAAVAMRIGRGRMDMIAVTNGARWVLIYTAAALVYGLVGRTNPPSLGSGEIAGGALATMVSFALSLLMVILAAKVRGGHSIVATWEKNNWVAPHYLAMGVLGIALTGAYLALGILGVVAFLTPALMMRLAMKQYVVKTTENVEKLEHQNVALTKANVEISRISDELRVSYDGTLEALVNALDARDQETRGHSIRVSRYMLDIAREMGVKEGTQEWIDMQRGSLLHDVGKIGVSDSILLKPGKLTPEEWDSMRKHPEIGYNMLRQVKFLEKPAEIILAHHERWDGQGYPRGLSHDEIPLGARIFSVVDTFDSMTSDRPYRKALSTQVALNEILKCSNSQFDPRVVEAFMDIYETWVRERDEMQALGDELGLVLERAA